MGELPFTLLDDRERHIAGDPDFLAGLDYGRPRPGHPEGAVKWHIADVLANVDRWYRETPHYAALRLIALVHDTFKYQVDPSQPKSGPNHHGAYARRFAERYIDDTATLDVIDLHDEAHNAFQQGHRRGDWQLAEQRARRLIARLQAALPLYLAFYRCDNETGDKLQASREWFETLVSGTSPSTTDS
jgi:hypothetical protein